MLAALALPGLLERTADRPVTLGGAALMTLMVLALAPGIAAAGHGSCWRGSSSGLAFGRPDSMDACCDDHRIPRTARRSPPRSSRCRMAAGC
jgi:hypothetical protein